MRVAPVKKNLRLSEIELKGSGCNSINPNAAIT